MTREDGRRIGDEGEKAFGEVCNQIGCEFLHIKQDTDEHSSKMWETGQKRPDFLVNIPEIASFFVDVKVRKPKDAGEKSPILASLKAFSVDISDFQKLRALENRTRIITWYAFFEMYPISSDFYGSPAYLVPLSRVEKHLQCHIRKKVQNGDTESKWEIRIPIRCMNQWSSEIDQRDKCQGCAQKYCEIFPK